jgi:hypothetical protein
MDPKAGRSGHKSMILPCPRLFGSISRITEYPERSQKWGNDSEISQIMQNIYWLVNHLIGKHSMFSYGSSVLVWLWLPAAVMYIPILMAARWSLVVSQPDEWLLRIHNGRLVNAGIGISVWRRPGDVIARFSSTIQRAGFSVEAMTQEHLHVLIDGFVLWTAASAGDGPFQAFSKIGIANLDNPPRGLKSKKHLLTSLQYHAFQGMIAAEI